MMRRSAGVAAFACAVSIMVGLPFPASASAPGITTRISMNAGGEQGNADSGSPAISPDGQFIVFTSGASNLVAADTNGFSDLFLWSRGTRQLTRVSVNSAGEQGNGSSGGGSVASGGRYVAFSSSASNLASGDTNGTSDVFVRDLQTGETTRASVSSGGNEGNKSSGLCSMSADGRYVAFVSSADNLVSDDTNGKRDVFVRDRQAGTTTRVSVSSASVQGDGDSGVIGCAISENGRFVAFASSATNLVEGDTNDTEDIFVRDLTAHLTERVSVGIGGIQADLFSQGPAISADGRYVAFESPADNLVTNDHNGEPDIFVRDRTLGLTARASVGSSGEEGNDQSAGASISSDGRFIAFISWATNLVAPDTNMTKDVFVKDTVTGAVTRASQDSGGIQANSDSFPPSICGDGPLVAFYSSASNLVANDTNNVRDVFLHDDTSFVGGTAEFENGSTKRFGLLALVLAMPVLAAGALALRRRAVR